VALGPRPAGSAAARALARDARDRLPRGRIETVAGGLANVVGTIPGRRPAVLVGAHYDTKDLDGFVGANDGASGTAVVLELARGLARAPRPPSAPELRFVLFDGEESPDDSRSFYSSGLRGSRAYAARHRDDLAAVVLLDMVGDERLRIPREETSDRRLWRRLRDSARAVGALAAFPDETSSAVLDDHTPFLRAGIPAIDVIDFDFECWHERCDDLDVVSARSLDAVGETVAHMLRRWR
jgi:Zn-dependent M28 family amino/carboxypeptidase